jgi:hypothetical protein
MVSRRALEALTAVVTGAFGVAVVVSSLDNGIGWGRGGVDSGTFPFITGVIVVAGSLYNLVRGLLAGREVVINAHDMKRVAALFLPAVAFVAFIPLVGMYVVSAVYLFGTLRLQNRVSVVRSLLIAAIAVVALYVVFERLFQVALPHGLLGEWLDL